MLRLSARVANLRTRIADKFTLPERLKGTIVEKWTNYWKALVGDYVEVAVGVVKEGYAKPRKALMIVGGTYAVYQCVQHNPDEEEFIRMLRKWNNEMVLVPTTLQNPVSREYLHLLERAINQNKLRTFSLGVCTLLWIDLYDMNDCTYPAVCDYTGVGYWNFHERIIDVGFWNNYWQLFFKMRNFDLNYL